MVTCSVPPDRADRQATVAEAEAAFERQITASSRKHPIVRYEGAVVTTGRFVSVDDQAETVTLAVSYAGHEPVQRTFPLRDGVDTLIPVGWVRFHETRRDRVRPGMLG